MSQKPVHIAVVGATGVVGREMLGALQELGYSDERITALASERSEGKEVDYAGETLEVSRATSESFRGMGLVLLAVPGEAASPLAKAAQAAGAWVVDVSPSFRANPQVPLVLPGVNDPILESEFSGRVVSVPSATTAGLLLALEPLRKAFGLATVSYTALVGASHWGERGIQTLEKQTADLLGGRDPEPELLPHRMAYNLVPQVGPFSDGWSAEELAVSQEARRLWSGQPQACELSGTVVQVPTFYGTCLSIAVQVRQPTTGDAVRQALKGAPAIKVLDAPGEGIYPMPMLVTADPSVHVGRVRVVQGHWVHLFAAVDNAGRGSALNAVEVGVRLLEQGV